MESAASSFEFFLSAKGAYIVVQLVGAMNTKASPLLEQLGLEIEQNRTATVLILNLRDVKDVSGEGITFLAQIQLEVRTRGEVRLTGVSPQLKTKLLAQGVIRTSEIFDNLQAAIQAPLKPPQKKTA